VGAFRLHLCTTLTLPLRLVRTIGTQLLGAQHGGLSGPQRPRALHRPGGAGSGAGAFLHLKTVPLPLTIGTQILGAQHGGMCTPQRPRLLHVVYAGSVGTTAAATAVPRTRRTARIGSRDDFARFRAILVRTTKAPGQLQGKANFGAAFLGAGGPVGEFLVLVFPLWVRRKGKGGGKGVCFR